MTFFDNSVKRFLTCEHVIHIGRSFRMLDAQGRRRISLRVEIHHQDAFATQGERCGDVHRRGGLTHPALLVGNRDDSGHVGSPIPGCSRVMGSGHPRPGFTPGVPDVDVSRETSDGQPKPLDPVRLEELTPLFCLSEPRHDDRGRWVDDTLAHLRHDGLGQAGFFENLPIAGDFLLGRLAFDGHE